MTIVRGLRAQAVIALSLVCLLALLIAGGVVWRAFQTLENYYGTAFARNYAQLLTQRMVAPLNRELALSLRLARSEVMREWARDESDAAKRSLFFREAEGYRNDFADRSYFVVLAKSGGYYFNDDKSPLSDAPRYILDPKDPNNNWFYKTLASNEDFNINVAPDTGLGVTKVWLNFLIRDGERKIGVAGSGLDLTRFVKAFVEDTEPGVTTAALNRQGAIQVHRNTDLIAYRATAGVDPAKKTLMGLVADAEAGLAKDALARTFADPKAAVTFFATMDGKRQVIAVSYSPELQWHIVAAVDLSAAKFLDPALFWPVLLAGGALLAVAFLGFWYAVDRIVLVPLTQLTTSAQRLADGSYSIELPQAGNNEIGDLTRTFGAMVDKVRFHTRELEQAVAARTEELRERNRDLAQIAERDELTGIGNRRMLMAHLNSNASALRGAPAPGLWAVAILDIDNFKKINDLHGHNFGDQVLVKVAQAIRRQMRDTDVCGRWGGEEFLILLPGATVVEAQQAAERIQKAFSELSIMDGATPVSVTASIGLAASRKDEGFEALIQRADEALYRAKSEGRNRIVCDA